MKLSAEQLSSFLSKEENLKPVFFLSGEEPLQMMEAADAIRVAAAQFGYAEREILQVETGFNWDSLTMSSCALSLFSEKKVLDLRLSNSKPGKAGSNALREYTANLPDDKILLIQTDKLDARTKNTAWVKALDSVGVMIQVWKLSPDQTLVWIAKRLRQYNFQPSQDAVRFLTERIEGNLLAAAQEINKLQLLYGEGSLSLEQVQESVSDSSRFNIFDLSAAVMQGNPSRVQHILHSLQQEGIAIQLVLWTLSDISRQLYDACFQLEQGVNQARIMSKIPRPRQQNFQVALRRLQRTADWQDILSRNANIDRLSKGQSEDGNKEVGRIWAELLELALLLSGVNIMQTQ